MGKHILVVDDEPLFRYSMRVSLKRSGFEVVEAGNGADALVLLLPPADASRFELLLLDLQMPKVSGADVLASLQRCEIRIPVVVVSGTVDIDAYLQLMALGCCEIFFKPVNESALLLKVREIMGLPPEGHLLVDKNVQM